MPVKSALEILAEELGAVAGQIERETGLRIDACIAEIRRIDAERELRLVNLEQQIRDRLAREAGQLAERVREALAALPQAEKGEKGDPGEVDAELVEATIKEQLRDYLASLPPPEKGEPGEVDMAAVRTIVSAEVREAVAAIPPAEKGEPGPQGSIAAAKAWFQGIHYAGEIRTHAGSSWQARCDTAAEPPHDDWTCIAERGEAGPEGRSLNPRRLWQADEAYKRLDVVALNGGSFVAMSDDPGPCPGEGWMLLTQQGKRGEPGRPGDKGMPGPGVVALAVDDMGMLTLTNGDGSEVQLDLYPLLSKLMVR